MLNILLCILVSLVILVIALRFKKAALILLGILIVVGGGFGIIVWQSGKPKEPKSIWKFRLPHTLSARDLMSHYERDAYGANVTYGNKVIALTGNVSTIYKEEFDKYPNQFRHVIWLRIDLLIPSSSKHGGGKTEYNIYEGVNLEEVSSSKHGGGKTLEEAYDDVIKQKSSSKHGGGKTAIDFSSVIPPLRSGSKHGGGKTRRVWPDGTRESESSSKHGGGKSQVDYSDFIPAPRNPVSSSKHGGGKVERVKCNFNRSEAYSLRNLKVGDSVKIKGRVSEYAGGLRRDNYSNTREPFLYVTLEDCVLVKSGK